MCIRDSHGVGALKRTDDSHHSFAGQLACASNSHILEGLVIFNTQFQLFAKDSAFCIGFFNGQGGRLLHPLSVQRKRSGQHGDHPNFNGLAIPRICGRAV